MRGCEGRPAEFHHAPRIRNTRPTTKSMSFTNITCIRSRSDMAATLLAANGRHDGEEQPGDFGHSRPREYEDACDDE